MSRQLALGLTLYLHDKSTVPVIHLDYSSLNTDHLAVEMDG